MGVMGNVRAVGRGFPHYFVLLLGFCARWSQQLVSGRGLGIAFGWVVHSHQISLDRSLAHTGTRLVKLQRCSYHHRYPQLVENYLLVQRRDDVHVFETVTRRWWIFVWCHHHT